MTKIRWNGQTTVMVLLLITKEGGEQMPVTAINVAEAQTQLQQLFALAMQGGDVVIAKDNVPLVRLVPVNAPQLRRTVGLHPGAGAMRMNNDFNGSILTTPAPGEPVDQATVRSYQAQQANR